VDLFSPMPNLKVFISTNLPIWFQAIIRVLMWISHSYFTAPTCIPRIKTFSSNDQHYFYKCEKPGDLAVYTKCPDHHFYNPEKQACFKEQNDETHGRTRRSATTTTNSNSEKPKIEDRQILGPVVLGLGDLYDAKTDRFLAGTSLWSQKTIQAAKITQNQLSSVTKYSTGRTLYEKLDEMNIKASLKLSFLGKKNTHFLFLFKLFYFLTTLFSLNFGSMFNAKLIYFYWLWVYVFSRKF